MSAKAQIRLLCQDDRKAYYKLCAGFEFDATKWQKKKYRLKPNADGTRNNPYFRVKAPAKKIKLTKSDVCDMVVPLLPLLSDEADKVRTLSEHREMIEAYAWSYSHGYDPMTGNPLSEKEKAVALENTANYNEQPYMSETRQGQAHDTEGMEILTNIFEKL